MPGRNEPAFTARAVEALEAYDDAQRLVRGKDSTKIIASRSASNCLRERSL